VSMGVEDIGHGISILVFLWLNELKVIKLS